MNLLSFPMKLNEFVEEVSRGATIITGLALIAGRRLEPLPITLPCGAPPVSFSEAAAVISV